jgi:hypothetical protein
VAAGLVRAASMMGPDKRELAPRLKAAIAAELGLLAFGRAYSTWSQTDGVAEDDLATYALTALDELRTAAAALD